MSVKLLQKSRHIHTKKILSTYELEIPRIILAEFNTHKMLVRNGSSCLAGHTNVYVCDKDLSNIRMARIEDLVYDVIYGLDFYVVSMDEKYDTFNASRVSNAFVQDIQPVYMITLGNGWKLSCTRNHRLFSNRGWTTLECICKFNGVECEKIDTVKLATFDFSCRDSIYRSIEKVEYVGKILTYDLEVSGKYNNFVADGFVVHNSRAIPIKDAIENLKTNSFVPNFWGKNKPGMVANEENNSLIDFYGDKITREEAWSLAKESAMDFAKSFADADYHKQIVGRLLEPFTMTKLVVSGTEWDNFYNLRIEPSAQPEFRNIAIQMYCDDAATEPFDIAPGEWHLPYIDRHRDGGEIIYSLDGEELDLETAKNISLSCIAQTSYRKFDTSLEKADKIIDKLFNGDVIHGSPAEHIATPIDYAKSHVCIPSTWEDGISHMDRDMNLWSAQFKDFIQLRRLIPNNTCYKFTKEKFLKYTKND